MFFTYLRRELLGRRKQTVAIAIGLGFAVALAMMLSAVTAGAKSAQGRVLQNLFGIGTDLTVIAPAGSSADLEGANKKSNRADMDAAIGHANKSFLHVQSGKAFLPNDTAQKTKQINGTVAVVAALELSNTTLTEQQREHQSSDQDLAPRVFRTADPIDVLAVDPATTAVGPLSSTKVVTGRQLASSDATTKNAVIETGYAKKKGLTVGSTITLGSTEFTVVGTVTSTSATTANGVPVYIPLVAGQAAADQAGKTTTVYVKVDSSLHINEVKDAISRAVPGVLVNTQSELASGIQSTVASAATTIANFGFWVSIGVLAAAFCFAVLLTLQGVARRTQELGTLKAVGWSNRRVVGQVAGESLVQALVGGALGIVLGLGGIAAVNLMNLQIGGNPARPDSHASKEPVVNLPADVVNATMSLQVPLSVEVIALAVGLAVLGGVIAGGFAGWRSTKLRPAVALRTM